MLKGSLHSIVYKSFRHLGYCINNLIDHYQKKIIKSTSLDERDNLAVILTMRKRGNMMECNLLFNRKGGKFDNLNNTRFSHNSIHSWSCRT